jgi:prepilin-type processing-associated H-X9-DG protein
MTGRGRELRDKILIVEFADSGISWLEPKDLNIDQMNFEINDWSRPGIRSHHRGGAHALFADGTVRFLKRRNQGDLKKLLRIDNGRVTKP